MKRSLLLLILVAAVLVCAISPVFAAEEEWTSIIEGRYAEENGTISVVEPGYHPTGNVGPELKDDNKLNAVLYNGFEAKGAYTVSVKMTGTMGLPNPGHAKEGIIPWYLDDDNYLVVYAEWADYERPTDMRCMQVTGRINGQAVCVFDSGAMDFLPRDWNDFWCDGIRIPQSDTYTLVVDVIPSEEYTSITFMFGTDDDPAIKSGEVWVQNSEQLSTAGKVGLYAMGDMVKFTEFSVEPIVEKEPEPTEPEPTEPEPTTQPQGTTKPTTKPNSNNTDNNNNSQNEQPAATSAGLIVGIVAVVVIAAAAAVVIIKKKK